MDGLIVAAGRSERTGKQYKMALEMGGRTVIENTVVSMAGVCSRIVVVTGFNADRLAGILQDNKQVEIVFNPNYNDGMYSSVKAGLKYISSNRFFFLPGDYPLVNADVFQAMLQVDADIVVPMYKGNTGHPVLFRNLMAGMILADGAYDNLREFISGHDPVYVEVDCPGILLDVDTLEDYRQATAMLVRKVGDGQQHGENKQGGQTF